MRIEELRSIEGRNIYSHYPVLRMRVRFDEWGERETTTFPGFNEKLLELLPGLLEHTCSKGYRGGFVERLNEGTGPAHVLEHVIIELMERLSIAGRYGKTIRSLQRGCWQLVAEHHSSIGALACARLGFEVMEQLLAGEQPSIDTSMSDIAEQIAAKELGPSTRAVLEAARKRGIYVRRLNDASLLQLGTGARRRLLQATLSDGSSAIAVELACDKATTKELLASHGLPVPEGIVAESWQDLQDGVKELGWPLVLKPLDSNQGKGVSLNITTDDELRSAWQQALLFSERLVLEKQIEGSNYRFLVIGDKLVAAAERIPAHVVGDGVSMVETLVMDANRDPKRGKGHDRALTVLPLDELSISVLRKQGLARSSIPPKDEIVWLRESANLSTGGSARDCTEEVHPQLADAAVRAAQIIGLDIAGIDLILKNPSLPLEGNGAIIEVNAAPGIRMHLEPSQGRGRPIGEMIVDHLFPAEKSSEIPIFAVTGTNGKTTTARLLSFALRQHYGQVGLACSDGIYRNDLCLEKGDTSGPASARQVLCDPLVEAAVLETARGGMIRGGLGYDLADIAIVTNISNDHLGQDEVETLEELVHAKALIVEAVRQNGSVVLNADEESVHYLSERTKAEIVLFSLRGNNALIRKHRHRGGKAVFWRGGSLWASVGEQEEMLLKATRVPITFQGKARHNLANAAAAAAALFAYGMESEDIRSALQEFTPSLEHNPGRQNLFQYDDLTVMIDYGHNQAGFQQMMAMAKSLKPKRLLGVLTVPGDRLDQDIIDAGNIAAGFDHVCFREDANLRGRRQGEIIELLQQGWLSGNGSSYCCIASETEAIKETIGGAMSGDMVLIFYEKLETALAAVQEAIAERQSEAEQEENVAANDI